MALVGIIMGSDSDLEVMGQAAEVLEAFNVPHELKIVSPHRTPDVMAAYASSAQERGLMIIIAAGSGSAHLPGMVASHTQLPVIAVPVRREHHDHEALWSNIKMPPGTPLATMPENGARNAGLFAIEILALHDSDLATLYGAFRDQQHKNIVAADRKLAKLGWQQYLKEKK